VIAFSELSERPLEKSDIARRSNMHNQFQRSSVERDIPETQEAANYALGYSRRELQRLELQAGFYRDLTRDVLLRAGLERGMRVLDLGCGAGDVSLLAGEIVGPSGNVLGVDRSPEAIETANRRAAEAGKCFWVRFASADLATYVPEEKFDAIIGRFVLMYLPDPAATLARLARCSNAGGIVAFHEMCMHSMRSEPETPLIAQFMERIIATFARTGFETDMGAKLYRTFLDAGLPEPQMISAARTEGGEASFAYEYIAHTVDSLLPAMERTGVATAEEVNVSSLARRLRNEAVSRSACIMLPQLTGAWTRIAA